MYSSKEKVNEDNQLQQQQQGGDDVDDDQVPIENSSPAEPSVTQLTEQLQEDRDHALAVLLQQQERNFAMLDTMETDEEDEHDDDELEEEEEDDEEEEAESYTTSEVDDDFDMTFSELFESEFNQGEEDEEEDIDDEIDPDELSYEELRELGEVVGEENRGLSSDQIASTLSPYVCEATHKSAKIIIDRCVICQVEYEQGEKVVALACHHPFHSDCITPWLRINKTCPICSMEITPGGTCRATSSDKTKPS